MNKTYIMADDCGHIFVGHVLGRNDGVVSDPDYILWTDENGKQVTLEGAWYDAMPEILEYISTHFTA